VSANIDEGSEVIEEDMIGSTDRKLMPWDEAYKKAVQVASRLNQTETYSLIRGFWANTSSSGSDPIPGYYVGNTDPIRRLGIPALKMQDSHNGFRATDPGELGTTTQWPCVLAMASSWDLKLVARAASAIGREFRGKGANVMLGPAVNVQRTARGGRNFEYLSGEDPYLGARLAETFVRSVQGEGVMTVVKHFAFNEQETNREHVDSAVDQRTAWELYYPPFEAAIKAGAGAMMCAYNKVNGTYACENDAILRHDLKTMMGFQGFVVSDWMATHSTQSIERGLDMEMPRGHWFTNDRLGVNTSWVAVLEAAIRVLASMFHLRLDEQPGCEPPCHAERKSNQRTTKHLELARETARDAIILLKNDGILPISPRRVKTLAVIGWAANQTDVQNPWKGSPYAGGGSAHVVAPSVVTPLDGIKERGASKGITVTDCNKGTLPPLQTALNADIVVVVATALTAEGWDRRSIFLNPKTNELISSVAKLRPTIVLLQTSGSILTPWREDVSAIANLFHGGEQTGTAWADILFGDASPVGKLPITFPATLSDTIEPSDGKEAAYIEELFTSYRSSQMKASFPFGHGLSYTEFKYSKPRLDYSETCKDVVCIKYEVTNVGDRPGAEVPQAYLRFMEVPVKEPQLVLRNFQKTRVLLPGEVHKGHFSFTERDLNIYRVGQGWFRPFDIEVHIGASSADIRHRIKVSGSGGSHFCLSAVIMLVATFLGLRATFAV
jgi:beta-glucosidase